MQILNGGLRFWQLLKDAMDERDRDGTGIIRRGTSDQNQYYRWIGYLAALDDVRSMGDEIHKKLLEHS